MKIRLIGLLSLLFITLNCKDSKVEKSRIPLDKEALSELEPDATYNDIATVYSVLEKNPDYNSLLKLVNQAEMFGVLQNLDDVTFFAPTNAAINRLSDDMYDNLRLPSNIKRLQAILKYHIVEGERDASMIKSTITQNNGQPYRLKTVQGGYIALTLDESGTLIVTDEGGSTAEVSQADIEASNGVIHDIEQVLLPNDQM